MKVHTLECEQFVPRGREEIFAFFDRPENLARLTPANLAFRLLTPAPVPMKEGAIIDYVIGLGGVPLRWRSLITAYEPPVRFVDEQILGPYSFWHHTHLFTPTEGGTLVGDRVLYALPLGPVGEFAHALFVRRRLEGIFAYRRRIIAERFGARAMRAAEETS